MNKYLFVLISFAISYGAYGESSAENSSGIGYKSVSEAYGALHNKEGVEGSVQQGWVIFKDSTDSSLWSFTPKEHPAHPAAIKRTVLEKNGELYIAMKAMCGAEKLACDELIQNFREMNEQMKNDMDKKREVSS